jgi:hypothetical protein
MSRPANGCIWVAIPTVYITVFLSESLSRSYSSVNYYASPTYSMPLTRPVVLFPLILCSFPLPVTSCVPTHCRCAGYYCLGHSPWHTQTISHTLGRSMDLPVAENSTWQYTTLTRQRQPRHRR